MIRRAAAALLVAFACAAGQPAFAEPEAARVFVLEADLEGVEGDPDAAMDNALVVARRRLEGEGPFRIEREGARRVAVEIAAPNARDIIEGVFGIPPDIAIRLVDTGPQETRRERGVEIVPLASGPRLASGEEALALLPDSPLDESNVVGALVSIDPATGKHGVNIRFDAEGADAFARLTAENVGERIAIVIDGEVLTAPIVREPISGGRVQISGNFTGEEANGLAVALAGGQLPVPFRLIAERPSGQPEAD
jgi:preprotein translocase subunit SecD